MRIGMVAPLALFVLASCGGTNPLGTGAGGGGTTPPPEVLSGYGNQAGTVTSIEYDQANDRLLVEIAGLDTTPLVAEWQRDNRFDTAGYRAYSVQEDPLDRLFIGLAGQSADETVSAAIAADGGQFNTYAAGGQVRRQGGFTPPIPTNVPGSGQVSYAGRYAGLTNITSDGNQLQPVLDPSTPQELRPLQGSRVSGDVFLNVNFSDNLVNGAIYNRMLVDYNFGLQSVILVQAPIGSEGTFTGAAQRWTGDDPSRTAVGTYEGAFGGVDAGNVGGIVRLNQVFLEPAAGATAAPIPNATEIGVFVLRQCGLSGYSEICDGVLPDIGN